MKVVNYIPPESSFLILEKDMGKLVDLFARNERLQKLLYYTTPDALNHPKLTEEQIIELFGKNIKMVPKVSVDETVLNYIIISFDNFTQSENPQFRNHILEVDIICHFDQWQLKDFSLRPYKIAGEIDSMLSNTRLTGIGELSFMGAGQVLLTDEFGGLCLMYEVTHSVEDKKNSPNLNEDENIKLNFDKIFNLN